MGNVGSSGGSNRHRRRRSHNQPPPQQATSESQPAAQRYVFPAATPYREPAPPPPGRLPAPPPPGRLPAPPPPGWLPAPYDHHHQAGRYPCPPPVEHQRAATIMNDVNVKKETIKVEADEDNPGKYLLTFTFDATVAGSITVIFFAKEGKGCHLMPTKASVLPPVIVHFEQGLGQKFRHPPGTGIDFSMFGEAELFREGDGDVFPLAVKADASPPTNEAGPEGGHVSGSTNSQITQASFVKDKGEIKLKVLKQILWVNGIGYELKEIYGIGNSVEGEFDANDPGKECVICLSEPRDTTVLPCRHMCMCSGCAKLLRFQTNRCPICRQPVERLLEIKVNHGGSKEEQNTFSNAGELPER